MKYWTPEKLAGALGYMVLTPKVALDESGKIQVTLELSELIGLLDEVCDSVVAAIGCDDDHDYSFGDAEYLLKMWSAMWTGKERTRQVEQEDETTG